MPSKNLNPLHLTATTTATDYWNDSCSLEELTYAINNGAVGATSNPTIVLEVVNKEKEYWYPRIRELVADHPTWNEEEITWQLIEEVALKGAALLLPIFEREHHRKGRMSIQTNPINYRNANALITQALHFDTLAPNMQVKIPVTNAGLQAIEEVTAQGVNINATVCFCVPQALAVAEAVERGLTRRDAARLPISDMSPVCTIMVGRMDDWLQVLVNRDKILTDPGTVHWGGIACIKRAYGIYQERKFRTRLLAAAYRSHLHWTELIGGDVVLTIPYSWQKQFNESDIEVRERFQNPVDPTIINELLVKFEDFRRGYEPDGLKPAEFDNYGPTVRTLRGFIGSYRDLISLVRNFMLPNPDIKP